MRPAKGAMHAMVRKLTAGALLVGVMLSATGCLTVGDDTGPILHVELFWDERPASTSFRGGTCHSADVYDMDWSLKDEQGREVAGQDEVCADAIDVVDMVPGEYSLDVKGYDRAGTEIWSVTCSGLLVARFDAAWACDVQAD